MKKNILIFVTVLTLVFIQGIFVDEGNAITKEEIKIIRFAGDENHPPYEYIDENGNYRGYNIDIINAIAHAAGLYIEIIPMEWNDAILALENNEVDSLIGMSQTEDRLKKYKFTSPTIINEQVIFVNKDTVHINSIEDLSGLKVSYQKNDLNESFIHDIPNVIALPEKDLEDCLFELANNEVDAVLGNRVVGIFHLQRNKLTDKIMTVGESITSVKYGPTVLKDNQELLNTLEEGLEQIKKNKTFDRIYGKWFGEDLGYIKLLIKDYKNEIMILAILIGLVVLFLYLYNIRLKKQVLKRTQELEQANDDLIVKQKEIYNLAYNDSITSLPNRIYFVEELNGILDNIKDEVDSFAVFFLDIDRFKHINDTLGHHVGDHILNLLGIRLSKLVKDLDIVARVGGDEFFILMKGIKDESEIVSLANSILMDFKEPYYIRDYELYLTTSIGIAIYPDGGVDTQALLMNSDLALYKAKDLGGNSYYIYGDEISSEGLEKMVLLNQLRQACDNDQLVLHYQPQIEIKTGKIVGLEALVRWNNPDKGLLYPDKFIALAEETGLIIQMGEWILRQACMQAREWIDQGNDIIMSVNISAKQFQHKTFVKELVSILIESGLEPKNLTLEITETIVISDIEYTLNILDMLKNLGIGVAIDDFGTGYSSLSYLNEMSVNELKIDRSFISDIEKNHKNKMLANTIIILAKQIGLKVTAEGVENLEQLTILKEMDCDIAQGYHFSKPVSKEKIDEMMN
ncbi:EAL domain-containing protein [Tissierella sp.]|uniref:EAL domain-containing protein n=1 Tax=Tissierella sp. TaxID=41274 RepID=UPI00286EA68A|nr:EAL domain-containing protein [Tissierella sp.]